DLKGNDLRTPKRPEVVTNKNETRLGVRSYQCYRSQSALICEICVHLRSTLLSRTVEMPTEGSMYFNSGPYSVFPIPKAARTSRRITGTTSSGVRSSPASSLNVSKLSMT